MTVGAEDFFKRIEDSGLLNDSIVEQKDRLRAADSGEAVAAELVGQKLLTAYQSEVLLSGDHVPLVIGDYVVTDSIGRGGMGYVLKARHRRMKRTVAIKFLLKSLTESDDLRRRFEREVEAAAKLNHQNIVTAYDAGVHDGSHYLVMEYVDGNDLSDIVKSSGPLGIPEAFDVIRQAATGLGFAHDRGIVHRDMKPGNLLLDSEGVVRILDMGLARMTPSPGDAIEGGAQADLTNTGSVMGTIDYMAPEQALDAKSVDHRADIYALGCTLYFLVTGNPPFRNETVMRRLLAHREEPAPRISAYRPDAPVELDKIFSTMMAKSPDDRYSSMKHLIAALDGLGLNDTKDGQMATDGMSENGIGGFAGLPGYNASTNSESASSTRPSSGDEPKDRAVSRKLPVSDVTILETPSNVSALTTLEDAESTSPVGTSDADFTGVSETIIGDSQSIAGAVAARGAKSQLPWKLIAPAGLALVAMIAFLVSRPARTTKPLEANASSASTDASSGNALLDDSQKADVPAVLHPDRRGAEWVLAVGGSVGIESDDCIRLDVEDFEDLPDGSFVLKKVSIPERPEVTDEGLSNLRGCSHLGAFYAYDTAISDQGLANLTDEGRQPLENLKSLFIARTAVTETGLKHLSGSKGLLFLDIQSNRISDGSLLGQFRELETLDIALTKISAEELSVLQELPGLRRLTVDGRQLQGVGSRHVSSLSQLKHLQVRYPGAGFHGALLSDLRELTKLDLLELPEGQLDDLLWSAVAGLTGLDDLYLDGNGVADASITKMPALPKLRVLKLKNGRQKLSGETIVETLARLPALKELDVSHNELSDNDAKHLEVLASLTQLTLTGNDITAASIKALHESLSGCRIISDHGTFGPTVTTRSPDRHAAEAALKLGGTVVVQDAAGSMVSVTDPAKLPAGAFVVTEIDLTEKKNIEDEYLANFRGLVDLQILILAGTSITDRGLANLTDKGRQPLPSLQRLDLDGTDVSQTGLQLLSGSHALWELRLNGTSVTKPSVLSQFPNLTVFDIAGTSLTSDDLLIIAEFSNLERLTMDASRLTETMTRTVADLSKLRALKLRALPSFFDSGSLAKFPLLTELYLEADDSTVFDDDLWKVIARLPELHILMCSGAGVTDESLAKAPPVPHVEVFIVMSKVVTAEAVVKSMSKFPNVKSLRISYAELTNQDVQQLHSLKSLGKLDLTKNSASVEAIKALSVALPRCQIISDHGTFGSPAVSMEPDRRAAEAVLKLGGMVWVGSDFQQIEDPAELPTEEFAVTKIDLSEKKNIEDKLLANFRGLADLEILILSETSITDRGLANLTDDGRQPLPSLQRLYLDGTNISQAGLQFLSGSHDLIGLLLDKTATTEGAVLDQFPKLAMLGLGYTAFTADELQVLIARFPQMNYLTMDGRHMSDTMITTLATIPKLRVLKLRELPSDFDPGGLAKLPLLTELYLDADDSTVFDDDFWEVVVGLRELRILMCNGVTDESLAKAPPIPQVEVFFVMSKVVTAEAVVKSMPKFPKVKSLSVNYSDWTDDDVEQLHSLKSLGKLDLTKNSASVEAIKALSAALPDCQIISDHGTFGPTKTE